MVDFASKASSLKGCICVHSIGEFAFSEPQVMSLLVAHDFLGNDDITLIFFKTNVITGNTVKIVSVTSLLLILYATDYLCVRF